MTARRPGRVQRLAYDDTPLSSRSVDVDARIGWLLAVSRLHHADPELSDGRLFVEALTATGAQASRSLVSRWESGEIPISFEGLRAYEQVLGLEHGRITSLSGYVRAALPGVRTRVVRPRLDPASPEFAARLDELIEMAEDGTARATDWQDLGWHLAAVPLVHLRARTWEALAHRLVNSLPRSVKVPYRQYSTAAMNIASIPRAQEYLTAAVADYLSTPGTQVWNNPVGLLDRLPTRRAAEVVLDLVEDPPDEAVRPGAVWVASLKLARGDFSEDERTRLDMIVLKMWRANPRRAASDLAELIAHLPEGMRSMLTSAAGKIGRPDVGHAVASGEIVAPDRAQSISEDLAAGTLERTPGDPAYDENRMLVRLVREALFHRDSERRHLAALLIASSPFGGALTDELLTLIGAGQVPRVLRGRAATLARYLSEDVHRLRMLRYVDDPDVVVASALVQGVGHLSFTPFSDQAIRSSLGEEPSRRERAKMYALGMSGSPALEVLARSGSTPEWQRAAAQWWIAQGPALRE